MTGNARGLPGDLIDRLAKMIVFLEAAGSAADFQVPPNYGAHLLTGDRAGTWSLTVSRNWRMTFMLNDEGAIVDLDLEDYH